MIRLLLADDEDLLRGALAALLELEEDLTVVAEAATTTDAVRLARQLRPDIAVLDLEMPRPTAWSRPPRSGPTAQPGWSWSPGTPGRGCCAAP
jgi:two-component system, NarL family, response regulator DesR